jgi:hypothetical protein
VKARCVAVVVLVMIGLVGTSVPMALAAQELASIYLIAVDDDGQSGTRVGCGDSLIPVQVDIGDQPTTEAKIRASLEALFAVEGAFYGESGLFNALHQSDLTVESVRLDFHMAPNDRAVVYLGGSLLSGGTCDDPRIVGQITATVSQFESIEHTAIVYNGDLLEFVLSPRGEHPDYRFFPETGHLVGHGFLRYWEQFGGLPVFGYPIGEEVADGEGKTVQYFERARFEWQAGAWPERFDVTLGRLGAEVASVRGLQATPAFQPVPAGARPGCTYVPQTSHHLCMGFRAYWQQFGGLPVFGYPISEEFIDPDSGLRVQYFERARFEWHPGTWPERHDVLLGRVGAEVLGK